MNLIKKQNLKNICFGVFLFVLVAILLSGIIETVYASTLEVAYPTVSGQTLTSDIKLPAFAKYLFNLGTFIGFAAAFISLSIAGAMYLLSAVNIELRAQAKDRIYGAISGVLILALTYLIAITINPQLSFLKLEEVEPGPELVKEEKSEGVYFYTKDNCEDTKKIEGKDPVTPELSGISNFDTTLKNKLKSVGIIQGEENSYISILYDQLGFRGKCQYLDPNKKCQPVSEMGPNTISASIHQYDFDPNGDGVYFYRKSYFDDKGGYYKVKNSEIKNIYVKSLDELQFTASGRCTVPKEEQDCVKYNEDGKCEENGRKCPTLAGENISSVKIKGDYIVMFLYFSPEDNPNGPWASCQEFPALDDVNRLGPQQIKWENIRNNKNVVPNYVIIIPIQ